MESSEILNRVQEALADLGPDVADQILSRITDDALSTFPGFATTEHASQDDVSISTEEINLDANTDELDSFAWFRVVRSRPPLAQDQIRDLAKTIEAGVFAEAQERGEGTWVPGARTADLNELARRGHEAMGEMLLGNVGLAMYWARRTRPIGGSDVEDRFQDAIFGLHRAILGWDWRRGYTFSTYASHWIRQAIDRYMKNFAYTIRLPVHIHERLASEPEANQVGNLRTDLGHVFNPLSWEQVVEFDYEEGLEIPDESIEIWVDHYSNWWQAHAILNLLEPRQRSVLLMRFGLGPSSEPMTLDEIGKILGVTRERVRQIETEAMNAARIATWSSDEAFVRVVLDRLEYQRPGSRRIGSAVIVAPALTSGAIAKGIGRTTKSVEEVRRRILELVGIANSLTGPFEPRHDLEWWTAALSRCDGFVPASDS
jgi:RNA polymerase primary sigma factor